MEQVTQSFVQSAPPSRPGGGGVLRKKLYGDVPTGL